MNSLSPLLFVAACLATSCAQTPVKATSAAVKPKPDPVLPLASYPPAQTKRSKQGDVDLVFVPAGEFIMGSNKPTTFFMDRVIELYDEGPIHTVNVDGFWISKKPITVGQVRAFCDATGTQDPYLSGADDAPAVDVTWAVARAYCQWQDGDLPTEAQWEKAARGTDARTYPWGYDFSSSKVSSNPESEDQNVSPYGCEDMVGVVYQWCLDKYDDGYTGLPSSNPVRNFGKGRVARGSSAHRANADQCRIALRTGYEPSAALDECGIRLVVKDQPDL